MGPCSPSALSPFLSPGDRDTANAINHIGGVPVWELAKGLLAGGHEVSVSTLDARAASETVELAGPNLKISIHRARPRAREFLVDNYRRERGLLAQSIRDFKPDIVHGHWTYEYALGALDAGLPCVITAHDSPFTVVRHFKDAYRVARLLIAQQVASRTDHLSAVSPYLEDRWKRQMRYPRQIEVIPNSAPTDMPELLREPAANPIIISIGDAGRLKNIRPLIQAFASVRLLMPSAELRLIGPGLGENDEICLESQALGLDEGLRFLGLLDRPAVAREFASAWLVAHPSLEEACPMTLLEALGAGVPALGGHRSGGVPYLLDWGRQGWLCDVTDPRAIASCMLEIVSSGPPQPKPGRQEFLDTNFSIQAVTNKYLGWYRDVLRAI